MRLLFIECVLACMPLLAQTGQLNISVKDDSGASVSGALVTVSARPLYAGAKSKPGPLSYNNSGKTGANGILSLANVPQGAYAICGRLPGSLLVDSCSWSDNPSTVFVASGATASSNILLKRGTRVVVQVNDASGLLKSEAFPGHNLRLVVGTAGGQRVPMAMSQTGDVARQFSLVVPADTDLKLQVRSETIQAADLSGNKIDMKDPKAFIPLRVPASSASASPAIAVAPQVQINLVGLL